MKTIPYKPCVYKFEVVRHMVHEPDQPMGSPEDVRKYFRFMEKYDREYVIRVDLNDANEMLGYETVNVGTNDMTYVGPKEVFRGALLSSADSFILLHNHPSGHVKPSKEDCQMAEKFLRLGDDMELQLLDVLIIGRHARYYSFAEHQWKKPRFRAW